MTDNIESLTLEQLRLIRSRLDQISDDMTDMRLRMGSIETAIFTIKRDSGSRDEVDLRQQASIDKLAFDSKS
ncbi:MAG: hypothetical protein LM550_14260 [Candidatus Contendobacter sp.]|jgi:prefoldin subunit 5|nr:hypothetical protein [Gammaproteobacteria bacterium]MCC8994816.1 hypothetical protein [Candidatus Contendobacter sp.]